MRVAMFYHSLRSCWNHGNVHFLRGVVAELLARGHEVRVFEDGRGWSITNLLETQGRAPLEAFERVFPALAGVVHEYESDHGQDVRSEPNAGAGALDLERALDGVDLVLVHEWNHPALVARIGAHLGRTRGYRLLFHDTHHRAVTAPDTMSRYDLGHYDGVLAFGRVLRDIYLERGWAQRAFTWHEAADTRVFRPLAPQDPERRAELVWIGNWGDEERSAELQRFLIEPARALGLAGRVHGVRFPAHARRALAGAGLAYRGWLPNHEVPRAFARHRVTVHVPRRPYVEALPGIPTIRPFEALACGIPLVCSPWHDAEGLFTPGEDFLIARDGRDMARCLRAVLSDAALARHLRERGLRAIAERHTCGHRVDELVAICRQLGVRGLPPIPAEREHAAGQPDMTSK